MEKKRSRRLKPNSFQPLSFTLMIMNSLKNIGKSNLYLLGEFLILKCLKVKE
jgi:hypothetical protein